MNALIDLDNCQENKPSTRKLSRAKNVLLLLLPLLFCASVNGVRWTDEQCMTDCVPSSGVYYCYTGWASNQWIGCNQIREDDNFYEVYYPTIEEGVWCLSRCKSAGYSYEWCFIDETFKNTKKCHSDRSINKTELNNIGKYAKNHNICNRGRTKRNNDYFDSWAMARHRLLYRDYNQRMLSLRNTSVLDYTTMNAPSLPNHDDMEITIRIRARIHFAHLQTRSPMPDDLNRVMCNMDRVAGDERGHLIAASLGGTNDAYNIVPQHRSCNRRAGGNSHWYTFENEIRAFLNRNREHIVDYHVIILYGDLHVTRRPTAFILQAIFYYPNATIERDTGPCYFTNNPDGPSVEEPDLGFSWHDELKLRDEGFDSGNWN